MTDDATQPSPSIWNGRFVHLLVLEALLQIGMFIINPIISSYLVAIGVSVGVAGTVAGLNSITAMAFRPVNGFIADLITKRSLLVGSTLLFLISALGLALSTEMAAIAFFRALMGVAFAIKSAVVVVMASATVPKEKTGQAVGYISMCFAISTGVGPLLGDWIAHLVGYRISFALAAALFLAGFLLAVSFKTPAQFLRKPDEPGLRERAAKALRSLRLRDLFYLPTLPYTIVTALIMIPQGMMMVMLLALAEQEGVSGAPWYFLLYAVLTSVTRPIAGTLVDRHGLPIAIVPGTLLMASGMLLLALRFSFATIMVTAVLMALGQGAIFATLQAESVRHCPRE
ncbi:MAG: MFS transporter, partial [Eggerthellaceae bacterium]|nr:MFS transporter [Eggerthellaceae bacterium]